MKNLFSTKIVKRNNDVKGYSHDCLAYCSTTCASDCTAICRTTCENECYGTCKTTCQRFCSRLVVGK